MKDKDIVIRELEQKVKELTEELSMATSVKETEVIITKSLRDTLEIKEIEVEELAKLNRKLVRRMAELRNQIKVLQFNC